MKKIVCLLILLSACTPKNTGTISLETLESKTGVALDSVEQKVIQKNSPQTLQKLNKCQSLSVNDIISLSEIGISDNFIICYLLYTKEHYNLSRPEIRELENHAVSQRVIRTLIESGD